MKRLALVAVAALTLAIAVAAPAISENDTHKFTPPEARCLLPAFEVFSAKVWAVKHWERGDPPASTIAAAHRRFGCAASPSHRKAMKATWKRDRAAYYKHRSAKLWTARVKPFVYPDGTRWAVPYPIAWCESGGDYYVGPYGAYGLIMEEEWLPPRVQDEIAHRLYLEMGEGPWAPYETGCAYR